MALTSSAFLILQKVLARQDPNDPKRQRDFRRLDHKAIAAIVGYAASVPLAHVSVNASFALFVLFPLLYFWPERRSNVLTGPPHR
jgi:hypothetical protein